MITNEYILNTSDPKMYWVVIFKDGKKVARVLVDGSETTRLKEHRWGVRKPAIGYAYSYCMECYNLAMHRLIVDAPQGMVVDHINHNTLDNRKVNLRAVTHKRNMQNRTPARDKKGPRLPIAGVSMTSSGKWLAVYENDGVVLRLGIYDHVYDACLARAREEYERRGTFTLPHRHWIYKLPMEFKVAWFPEIYGPENEKFKGSMLHQAFFYKTNPDLHDLNIKLNVYRKEYRKWKAASNV